MKFLHLSDLHIGKSVNGFSMLEEQRNIFAQIVNYIELKKPQAVLIAGDIYDKSVPGVEAVRLFDDFLTELATLDVSVMAIAGNHDSQERLSYASRLLASKNIHFGDETDITPIKLSDEYGEVNFWLVPFVRSASDFPKFEGIDCTSRNVIVAHQLFAPIGSSSDCENETELILSDSEINIGGIGAFDVSILAEFDYVALGHLHKVQRAGSENIRYAGSPLKYSFSEVNHDKSVTLVELCEKGEINIEMLPLRPIHDMRELRGTLDELISEAIGNPLDYMRVVLTDESEIIDPMGKIRAIYPNVMTLEFENSRTNVDFAGVSENTMGEIEKLSPFELFAGFFLEARGFAMSDKQEQIAQEILADMIQNE